MSRKKKDKGKEKISPTPPYKRKANRKKNQPRPIDKFSSLSAHACACEAEVDQVRLVVDQAVDFCHAEDRFLVPAEIEHDRKLWLKLANRNLNSFIGIFMEFSIDIEEKGWHFRHRPSAFQKRLNTVYKNTKGK